MGRAGVLVRWVTEQGLEPGSLLPVEQIRAGRVRVDKGSARPASATPAACWDLRTLGCQRRAGSGGRTHPRPLSRAILERRGGRSGPPRTAAPAVTYPHCPGPGFLSPPRPPPRLAEAAACLAGRPGPSPCPGRGMWSRGMLGPSLPASAAAAAARGGPAPAAWALGDWLRCIQAPPLGSTDFPKPAGGGNVPETPALC